MGWKRRIQCPLSKADTISHCITQAVQPDRADTCKLSRELVKVQAESATLSLTLFRYFDALLYGVSKTRTARCRERAIFF